MRRVRWVLGCRKNRDVVKEYLEEAAEYLGTLDIAVILEQEDLDDYGFFSFRATYEEAPTRDLLEICRHHVAGALAKAIVEGWEPGIILNELERNYDFLEPDETREICELGTQLAAEAQPDDHILNILKEYLQESHLLIVDGFVAFRLGCYVLELGRIAQKAVDAFLVEREYREFVRLLRYFVDVQEPRVGETHVFVKRGEAFEICDDEGHTMDDRYLNELVAQLAETEVSHEDLVVSVLITLAPESIVLHCPAERLQEEAIRTVRDVFYRRVQLCTGCAECMRVRTESE